MCLVEALQTVKISILEIYNKKFIGFISLNIQNSMLLQALPHSKLLQMFYNINSLHIVTMLLKAHYPCPFKSLVNYSRGYDSVIRRMQSLVCLLYNLYNTHEFILHMTWCHAKNELVGVV